jgi:small subunit ribosomal protein S5
VAIDGLPLAESAARWRPYSEEEKQAMKYHYTPSQIAAIEATESAVPAEDLAAQAVLRDDPWSLNYWDDLRQIDPLVDKQPKAVVTDVGPVPELLKLPEFRDMSVKDLDDEGFDRWRKGLENHINPRRQAYQRDPRSFEELLQDVRGSVLPQKVKDHLCGYAALTGTEKEAAARDRISAILEMVGKPPVDDQRRRFLPAALGQTLDGDTHMDDPKYSALAPAIPKFEDPNVRWPTGDEDDPSQAGIQRLALQTGFLVDDIRRFKTKRLVQHRVVNQTRMGKIQSIYVLTIAGNGNGLFGIGEGKSAEIDDARRQSMLNAIRNMKPIHRYENRTIYGEVHGKVGATEVQLMSRPPGKSAVS